MPYNIGDIVATKSEYGDGNNPHQYAVGEIITISPDGLYDVMWTPFLGDGQAYTKAPFSHLGYADGVLVVLDIEFPYAKVLDEWYEELVND
jgi:hypothetical protein